MLFCRLGDRARTLRSGLPARLARRRGLPAWQPSRTLRPDSQSTTPPAVPTSATISPGRFLSIGRCGPAPATAASPAPDSTRPERLAATPAPTLTRRNTVASCETLLGEAHRLLSA